MLAFDALKQKAFPIKKFSKFLSKNLCTKQREKFLGIEKDGTILKSEDLNQLNISINNIKEVISNLLIDLKEKGLKKLKELSENEIIFTPFLDVFKSPETFIKKIEDAKKENDWHKIENISEELAKKGCFDKSIKVANMITDTFDRGSALKSISKVLIESGKFDKIVEVAGMFTDEIARYYETHPLENISEELAKKGCIDESIKVANMITDTRDRGNALKYISKVLIESGKIDKIVEIAGMFTDKIASHYKTHPLKNISKKLAKKGYIDESIKVANMITDKS